MIKKPLLVFTVCLILLTALSALAQDSDKYADCLYPIRINGLWGYMNYEGEIVLKPQWTVAREFRGKGYACVCTKEDPYGIDSYGWGIIDQNGEYAVPPSFDIDEGYDGFYYGGKDTGIIWIGEKDGNDGFFDVASGCWSGQKYTADIPWVGSGRLIPVRAPEGQAEWWRGIGFADRTTGDLIIPYMYDMIQNGYFEEGLAYVEYQESETSGGMPLIINEKNEILPIPDGVEPLDYHAFTDGLLIVQDTDTKLFGYIDRTGALVLPAIYDEAEEFDDGYANVCLDGVNGFVDRQGNFKQSDYPLVNGLIVGIYDGAWGAKDIGGNLIFSLNEAKDISEFSNYYDNDSFSWYKNADGDRGVIDRDGKIIIDASLGYKIEEYSFELDVLQYFQEDRQVFSSNGKYGFVDINGTVTVPFVWDYAFNYCNGLACVEKDGKMVSVK